MKLNSDYKAEARAALKGNWAPCVLATIVFVVIACALSGSAAIHLESYYIGSASLLVAIFLLLPLQVGFRNAFKRFYLYSEQNVTGNTFTLGFTNYLHIVGASALVCLYTILWSLLLVIPGIVKAYAYSMTPYILLDNPELGADQAIHHSRQLMQGRKMDLFLLDLSFIGWFILGAISLGIGYLWIIPFFDTTRAAFYTDLKADWEARNLTSSPASEPSSDKVYTGTLSMPDN